MRLHDLLTNIRFVVKEAMNMSFPILTSTLSPKQRERFLAAVQAAEAGHAAGAIANQVYLGAKETINRALETAVDQQEISGYNLDRWNWSRPQLHTIAGMVKKLRSDDNPAITAFMKEIAPLGTLFVELKTMVVKRQPKPVEERKEGYHPPSVTSEAQAKVVALLEQVTQESYNALREGLMGFMRQSSRDLSQRP